MTDAQYTALPQWPNAYPASGARASLKVLNEDFIVTELPLQLPSGQGEHLWLDVEKNGANTAFVDLVVYKIEPRVRRLQPGKTQVC